MTHHTFLADDGRPFVRATFIAPRALHENEEFLIDTGSTKSGITFNLAKTMTMRGAERVYFPDGQISLRPVYTDGKIVIDAIGIQSRKTLTRVYSGILLLLERNIVGTDIMNVLALDVIVSLGKRTVEVLCLDSAKIAES